MSNVVYEVPTTEVNRDFPVGRALFKYPATKENMFTCERYDFAEFPNVMNSLSKESANIRDPEESVWGEILIKISGSVRDVK